ncbi:hypothetical protein BsWGS_11203 [Bradybaena similaris]
MSSEDISHGIEAYPIITCHAQGSRLQKNIFNFKYVKTNVPGPGINREKFTEQFSGCACSTVCTVKACLCLQLFGDVFGDDGKLKSNDLQDLSSKPILECGHACSCDPVSCRNRVVQKGIKTKLSVFQTKNKGFGLMLDSRNGSLVPRLSFVCEYAGEVVGHKEAIKRIKETDATQQDNYLIAVKEHVLGSETCTYIDPRCIGNVGRFSNHSCDPNLFMVLVRVNHQVPRLALFARKDIHPGDELTFDYSGSATLNVSSLAMNVESSLTSPVATAPSTSGAENSTMFQCDAFIDKLTHLPESLARTHPPTKRMKFEQLSYCDSVTEFISSTETESNCSSQNDITDSKQEYKVTDVPEMLNNQPAANGHTGTFNAGCDKTTDMTAIVKRKPCFCGSINCTGFLPLDSNLLYD